MTPLGLAMGPAGAAGVRSPRQLDNMLPSITASTVRHRHFFIARMLADTACVEKPKREIHRVFATRGPKMLQEMETPI